MSQKKLLFLFENRKKKKETRPTFFAINFWHLGYSSSCYFCPICFIFFITQNKIFIRKKNRCKVSNDLYRMYEISLNLPKYSSLEGKKKCKTDLKKKVGKKASTKRCFFCLLSLFNEYQASHFSKCIRAFPMKILISIISLYTCTISQLSHIIEQQSYTYTPLSFLSSQGKLSL